jgi:hypothetical protein
MTKAKLVSRRHWDGVVIDCDNVPGGADAIAEIRNSFEHTGFLFKSEIVLLCAPAKSSGNGSPFQE